MKKTVLFIALLASAVLLALSGASIAASGGRSAEELFFKANQAFRNAGYSEAALCYEQIIAGGYASGHVYYNLGNACFKMNRLGSAILNYERARLLIPRDADLAFNLSYAQDRKQDAVQPPQQAVSSVIFWLNSFNLSELFWIFIVCNAALFCMLLLRLAFRGDWSYYLLMMFLFLWFMGLLSFGLKYYETAADDRGVVTAVQADVLAGPQSGDTVLFRLHEGSTVRQERFEPGWRLISLPDGKRGWIRAADIQSIVNGRLKPHLW